MMSCCCLDVVEGCCVRADLWGARGGPGRGSNNRVVLLFFK